MTTEELKAILESHKRWAENKEGGTRANLRGVSLRGVSLHGADLCDANLRGVSLHGADLCDANLRGADLRGADLRGADLRGVSLRDANLHGANLRDADLRDADLRGADLRGADLRGADLDYSKGWKFACSNSRWTASNKQRYQMLAHIASLHCADDCTPEERAEYEAIMTAILPFAVKSHRAADLGITGNKTSNCEETTTK